MPRNPAAPTREAAASLQPALRWLAICLAVSWIGACGAHGAPAQFRRGDSNSDTRLDISDSIQTLGFLFLGSPAALDCRDAADTNDDGRIDLSDAVYGLVFLFLGGTPPPPPHPACGPDPTLDPLDCRGYGDCGIFVTIESPLNLSVTSSPAVDVSGTVGGGARWVLVNGVGATITGGRYLAAGVSLVEGTNRIGALASDGADKLAAASIQVVLDTTAPRVVIVSPENGALVFSPRVTVTGAINDTITGAVNEAPPRCQVAGSDVPVVNGAFTAPDVELSPGPNTIVVTVTDLAGNVGTAQVQVEYESAPVQRIEAAGGQLQAANIGEPLPQPLVAQLLDAAGRPVEGRPVVFRVTQSNGRFSDGTRVLAASTGADGKASASFTAGTRAGEGANRVEATALGFSGKAVFLSTSLAGPPVRINASSGTPQRGAVSTVLPEPLVAIVLDAGGNGVPGVLVRFHAAAGGGHFEPEGLSTVERRTDIAGHVVASLVLGAAEGIENNLVEASIGGVQALPASFVASALVPGLPAETSLSGIVLDHEGASLPGVMLGINGTELRTLSDAQGQFRLDGIPVGPIRLLAFGQNTTRPGTWPTLEYDMVAVPGVDNRLTMPIHLLRIQDEDDAPMVGGGEDVSLTIPGVAAFELKVPAHSTLFDGVRRPGKVTVTQVRSDKVPMTPVGGAQPTLVVTIQPPSVRFDPPAPIAYPNSSGLGPGEITEMYSFDHDLGRFVTIGPGTVSEDGMVIRSNPGFGILKGGWQYTGPRGQQGEARNCSVSRIASDHGSVVCVNKRIRFTATGSPGPGRMEWSGGDEPPSASFTQTTSTFETIFRNVGVRTIKATWTCESGQAMESTLEVSVIGVELEMESKLVRLRNKIPDTVFPVHGKVHVIGNPNKDVVLTLLNPNGKLRFLDTPAVPQTTLVVPRGTPSRDFTVYGVEGSGAVDDALIAVYLGPDGTGSLCAVAKLTVFHFDGLLEATPAAAYSIIQVPDKPAVLGPTPGSSAIHLIAVINLLPSGLDCNDPALKDLKIGFVQNVVSSKSRVRYRILGIDWLSSVSPGVSVSVPTEIDQVWDLPPGPYNDCTTVSAPLYDKAPLALTEPRPCSAQGIATSDSPNVTASDRHRELVMKGGEVVGTAVYARLHATLQDQFMDWAVTYNSKTQEVCPIRETTWSLDVDTSRGPNQKASSLGADRAPTQAPLVAPPCANDVDKANGPKNVPVGTGTTTFTKP